MNREKELTKLVSACLNVSKRARAAAKVAKDPIEREGDWHIAFMELDLAKKTKARLAELQKKKKQTNKP